MTDTGSEQAGPRVGTVLLSYNRPRMLAHAIASLAENRPDAVAFVDDGSDVFDAAAVYRHEIESLAPSTVSVLAAPRSVRERLVTPSLGALINRANAALAEIDVDVVTYLCDDDLFAPGWLAAVRDAFRDEGVHVARGRWRTFSDPCDPEPLARPRRSRPSPLDWRQMTTGNFAHRIECVTTEGVSWEENRIAVHDDYFLWRLHAVHPLSKATAIPVLAGYRRDHPKNASRYAAHSEYTIGAEHWLERGALE